MAHVLQTTADGDEGWPAPDEKHVLTTAYGDVTQSKLAQRIDWLLPPGQLNGADILFYFAGHGVDDSGSLLLATSEDDPADLRSGYWIRRLVDKIKESECRSATIILDCCNAGLATRVEVPRNTVILAGTGTRQEAKEVGGRGVFTTTAIAGLEGAAADITGRVTAISLYNYAAGALGHAAGQFPAIKARMEQPLVLKKGRRKVERDDLLQLPKLFPRSDGPRQVTPDHEDTEQDSVLPARSRPYPWPETRDKSPEQKEMDYYKRFRDAGLLEAFTKDGEKTDLFWACLDSGEVRLTPLGQYYWQLAKENRNLL
jgi:hypothetical protein